jgi:hypothetical protein
MSLNRDVSSTAAACVTNRGRGRFESAPAQTDERLGKRKELRALVAIRRDQRLTALEMLKEERQVEGLRQRLDWSAEWTLDIHGQGARSCRSVS